MNKRRSCDYCGLVFTGGGYSPDDERHFCCYGCFLVQRIIGAQGEEGMASWILLRLGIGAFLAMNVMMISLVLYFQPESELGAGTVRAFHWALIALSTPAMAILGAPFLLGAAKSLRQGRLSMDTLIVSGAFTAYGFSTANVIRDSGHIYFDTATMLLLIVTLGRLLEASAKNRTSRAIREIVDLSPERAVVIRDGREIEILTRDVLKGDRMTVRPGGRIPADGRIVSGQCLIEEAAFTGESRPRSCSPGDVIYGGSVNCDGLIEVEATAVGSESLLAQIQRMVHQAQQERAPVERAAERMAAVFIPAVWLVALMAGFYWGLWRGDIEQAGMSALAILVVACPCALGIATPMATCLAIGKAARVGVLIRSGETLERLSSIERMFFDKTGTLTANDLSVSDVLVADGISPHEALGRAASLEAGSEHAIARAIVKSAEAEGIALGGVGDFRVISGRGVTGTVVIGSEPKLITVGSLSLLSEKHEMGDIFRAPNDYDSLTTTYAGWDGRVMAAIFLNDSIRSETQDAINGLEASRIKSTVISGDREGPVRRVASELEIPDFFFGCSPAEKAYIIGKARESCAGGVAMVGDGINDAPALAAADVGIAIGGGTDLAREASDVTLLGDDLSRIPWVIDLSRKTYKIIRQNLLWAFGYNSVAVILAFLGYVHPLIAAIAMFASSLAVIANSMR